SSAGHDGYMVYENGAYWIISGTSAAAPAFAGVMALVVERTGGLGQGSANAELYSLVNAEPIHSMRRNRETTAFQAWRDSGPMAQPITLPPGWARWTVRRWPAFGVLDRGRCRRSS